MGKLNLNFDKYSHVIFDLDGTLYPRNSLLFKELRRRTRSLFRTRISGPDSDFEKWYNGIATECPNIFDGLRRVGLTGEQYFTVVFGNLPYASLLPQPKSPRPILQKIRGKKYVVTFSPGSHAVRVLGILDCMGYINEIYSIAELPGAPNKIVAYRKIIGAKAAAENVLVVGDSFGSDLQEAAQLGFQILQVGDKGFLSAIM